MRGHHVTVRAILINTAWGADMEVWDALRTRLTVRQFKPDPVPDEIVTKLLQVGL